MIFRSNSFVKKVALSLCGAAMLAAPAKALQLIDPENIQWIYLAGKAVPDSLYSAGEDKDKVVRVCRVRHRKDHEIGYLQDSLCQIGGDGMSRPYSEYEVMVFARKTEWVPAKRKQLPPNGQDMSAGNKKISPLYMCRIHYEGDIAVGTINDKGYCITGYSTGELKSDEFDLFVSVK